MSIIENLETLKQMKSLEEIMKTSYWKKNFRDRYINDLPRMALEIFNIELTWQQIDVLNIHSFKGGRTVVASGHSCMGIGSLLKVRNRRYPVSIENVKIGNILIDAKGNLRTVEDIVSGTDRMYRISYKSGFHVDYTSLHTLILYHDNQLVEIQIEAYFQNQEKYKDYHAIRQTDNCSNTNEVIVSIEYIGVKEYIGLMVDGDNRFYDYFGILTSNTGKTKLLSIMATAYILLFPKSLVRIQAPKSDQVTKFSFKEISANLDKMKAPRKISGKYYNSKWGFLANFIQANKTLIFVKGFQTSWYIEPATAPKGEATNLSGQHNRFYLLIFDEMSGIPDDHIVGSLGGVSETHNSCIGFSQHTNTSSKFHQFMTTLSKANGGVWNAIILNSEESPRVKDKEIEAWRSTYNDNEYDVRVKGLPPTSDEGCLLSSREAYGMYSLENKPWVKDLVFKNVVLSSDVAYTGLRDKGIVLTARVANIINERGMEKLYMIIDDIYEPRKKIRGTNKTRGFKPLEQMEVVKNKAFMVHSKYPQAQRIQLAVDANSGGDEAYGVLEEEIANSEVENIDCFGFKWGTSAYLTKVEKAEFINQKAICYKRLQEAVQEDRVYVTTTKKQALLVKEMSKLYFSLTTDSFRMKMVGKEELKKKYNISSPDIADTIAQIFLVPFEPENIGDNKRINKEEVNIDDKEEEEIFEDGFSSDMESSLIV